MAAEASTWLWTCGGICFGYKRGNSLFAKGGEEVGRFVGPDIYGSDGRYLGEIMSAEHGGRLITNTYKKSRRISAFVPTFADSYDPPERQPSQPMYSGHEEFPSPEAVIHLSFPRHM